MLDVVETSAVPGFHIDPGCFNTFVPTVEETMEMQALNSDSDITGSLKLVEVARAYAFGFDGKNVRNRNFLLDALLDSSLPEQLLRCILYSP